MPLFYFQLPFDLLFNSLTCEIIPTKSFFSRQFFSKSESPVLFAMSSRGSKSPSSTNIVSRSHCACCILSTMSATVPWKRGCHKRFSPEEFLHPAPSHWPGHKHPDQVLACAWLLRLPISRHRRINSCPVILARAHLLREWPICRKILALGHRSSKSSFTLPL